MLFFEQVSDSICDLGFAVLRLELNINIGPVIPGSLPGIINNENQLLVVFEAILDMFVKASFSFENLVGCISWVLE
jgi:hypothetical protein